MTAVRVSRLAIPSGPYRDVANTKAVGHTSNRCPTGSAENNDQGTSTGDTEEPSTGGGWGADAQDAEAGGWGSGSQDKGNDDVEPDVEAHW